MCPYRRYSRSWFNWIQKISSQLLLHLYLNSKGVPVSCEGKLHGPLGVYKGLGHHLGFLVLASHHESRPCHEMCTLTQQPCGSEVDAPFYLIVPSFAGTAPISSIFAKFTKYFRRDVRTIVRESCFDLSCWEVSPISVSTMPMLSGKPTIETYNLTKNFHAVSRGIFETPLSSG